MTTLSPQLLQALREALASQPEVARALFRAGGEKPVLVLECDERPASVHHAQERQQRLVPVVGAALGDAVSGIGLAAGGPEDVRRLNAAADVVYVPDADE